jgi:hypothetical protein
MASGIRERIASHPKFLDDELAAIAGELENRPRWVFASRDRLTTWEGEALAPQDGDLPPEGDWDVTQEVQRSKR